MQGRWRQAVVGTGAVAILLVSASRVVPAEHWLVDLVAGIVATVGVGMIGAAMLGTERLSVQGELAVGRSGR